MKIIIDIIPKLDAELDYKRFFHSLSSLHQQIMGSVACGYTMCEIGSGMSLSNRILTKECSDIRWKWRYNKSGY